MGSPWFVMLKDEHRKAKRSAAFAAVAIALSGCLFVLAAAAFPGGDYNPCLRMLSALGRTEVRMVTHPWSQYLFMSGMFVSAVGVFACNNHPHVALAIFKALGYGDWTRDAQRWEAWALNHFVAPILGGGAVGLAAAATAGTAESSDIKIIRGGPSGPPLCRMVFFLA